MSTQIKNRRFVSDFILSGDRWRLLEWLADKSFTVMSLVVEHLVEYLHHLLVNLEHLAAINSGLYRVGRIALTSIVFGVASMSGRDCGHLSNNCRRA